MDRIDELEKKLSCAFDLLRMYQLRIEALEKKV